VLLAFILPESHVFYMNSGDDKGALKVLAMGYSEEESKEILESLKEEQKFYHSEKITT